MNKTKTIKKVFTLCLLVMSAESICQLRSPRKGNGVEMKKVEFGKTPETPGPLVRKAKATGAFKMIIVDGAPGTPSGSPPQTTIVFEVGNTQSDQSSVETISPSKIKKRFVQDSSNKNISLEQKRKGKKENKLCIQLKDVRSVKQAPEALEKKINWFMRRGHSKQVAKLFAYRTYNFISPLNDMWN